MTGLTLLWLAANAVIVVSTIYCSLLRGRPIGALEHARALSRLAVSGAALVGGMRALQGVVYVQPEFIVMVCAVAAMMVSRAVSEGRAQRLRASARG